MKLCSWKTLIWIALLYPYVSARGIDRHPTLSYSRQHIQILPQLFIEEMESVERIIFLHIPKTAGTNLHHIASVMSRSGGQFHYQRLPIPIPQGSEKSPTLITPGWIGGLEQLENSPTLLDAIPQTFFLSGHFPYGLHERFSTSCKYITLVRHPLERELSSAHFAYQRGYIERAAFEYYITEQMIDNPQARLIAGIEFMTGPCDEKTLSQAKENIENNFLLAAPSEDVDCFLQVLASIQKWGSLAYAPMQITREKAPIDLSPLLTEKLVQKHEWDLKLYEWVKARWSFYKEKVILGTQPLSSEDRIRTLMPNHLSTHEAHFLSVREIDAYNSLHASDEFLKLEQ